MCIWIVFEPSFAILSGYLFCFAAHLCHGSVTTGVLYTSEWARFGSACLLIFCARTCLSLYHCTFNTSVAIANFRSTGFVQELFHVNLVLRCYLCSWSRVTVGFPRCTPMFCDNLFYFFFCNHGVSVDNCMSHCRVHYFV